MSVPRRQQAADVPGVSLLGSPAGGVRRRGAALAAAAKTASGGALRAALWAAASRPASGLATSSWQDDAVAIAQRGGAGGDHLLVFGEPGEHFGLSGLLESDLHDPENGDVVAGHEHAAP